MNENTMNEEEREAKRQEAIALLVTAVELYERANYARPFMTLNTGPKGATVEMKFKDYDDATDVYSLMVKFFSANKTIVSINEQNGSKDLN